MKNSLNIAISTINLCRLIVKAPPGKAPREGLFWYEPTHRWRKKPEAGGSFSESELHAHVESELKDIHSQIGDSLLSISDDRVKQDLGIVQAGLEHSLEGHNVYGYLLDKLNELSDTDNRLEGIRNRFWELHELVHEGDDESAFEDSDDEIDFGDNYVAYKAFSSYFDSMEAMIDNFGVSMKNSVIPVAPETKKVFDELTNMISNLSADMYNGEPTSLIVDSLNNIQSHIESSDIRTGEREFLNEIHGATLIAQQGLDGLKSGNRANLSLSSVLDKFEYNTDSGLDLVNKLSRGFDAENEPSYINIQNDPVLQNYTETDDCYVLNTALLNDEILEPEIQRLMDKMRDSMKSLESPHVLYRGMKESLLNDNGAYADVGDEINLRAFMSTSRNPAVAHRFQYQEEGGGVFMEIQTDANTKGMTLSNSDTKFSESETILDVDQRFTVESVEMRELGGNEVEYLILKAVPTNYEGEN